MLLCISFLTALTKFEDSNSLIIVTFCSGWKSVMTSKAKIKWHSFYYKTCGSSLDMIFLTIYRFAMLQFGGSEANNSVAIYGAGPIL